MLRGKKSDEIGKITHTHIGTIATVFSMSAPWLYQWSGSKKSTTCNYFFCHQYSLCVFAAKDRLRINSISFWIAYCDTANNTLLSTYPNYVHVFALNLE